MPSWVHARGLRSRTDRALQQVESPGGKFEGRAGEHGRLETTPALPHREPTGVRGLGEFEERGKDRVDNVLVEVPQQGFRDLEPCEFLRGEVRPAQLGMEADLHLIAHIGPRGADPVRSGGGCKNPR